MEEYSQYLKERHQSYVDQRKNLDALAFQMGDQHDKWVLTLSGGALGVSMTFLDKIVSHPEPWTKLILFIAWLALGVSLLCAFYGIHYSHCAITRQMAILDSEYALFRKTTTDEVPEGETLSHHKGTNELVAITQRWSRAARICTVSGILLLSLFCFLNVRSSLIITDTTTKSEIELSTDPQLLKVLQAYKEKQMSDADKPTKSVKGSYVPPANEMVAPAPKPKTESYVPPTNTIPPPPPKKNK